VLLSTEKALLSDHPPAPMVSSHTGSQTRECPRCDSQSIARSRIRGMFGQMARRMFGLRPYRCLDCWHRFMGFSRDS
jgi:DNA-directed RNA polymerase subunit RPC12/RpoP